MAADPSERVFLVGMVGAGKTTVGRALGERTGWPYLDNDDLVHQMTGRESADIFETDGEDVLHLAEIQALDVAFGMNPPLIVGVAGAVVTDTAAREALRDGGYVVWLRAKAQTLIARVGDGASANRCTRPSPTRSSTSTTPPRNRSPRRSSTGSRRG
jgi:shikimate kinase